MNPTQEKLNEQYSAIFNQGRLKAQYDDIFNGRVGGVDTTGVLPGLSSAPVETPAPRATPLDALKNYGQTIKRAAGEVTSPFTQIGKSVFDATISKDFTESINKLNEQNNRTLDHIKTQGYLPGSTDYIRLMRTVKDNLQLANQIREEQKQARADIDFTGVGNEDVANLLDRGDYGRAFLRAATGGAGAATGAVFAPLAVPAQALVPSNSVAGKVVQGAITGAGLAGPAGAVAGGLFGLLPSVIGKIKENPAVSKHLTEHPEDEKIFNDVLSLSLTVLGQKLAQKTTGQGKPDILNTPVSQVPGRVGGNLVRTALVPVKIAQPLVDSVAKSLEKANLRLTPQQKANFGKKIDDVVDFNNKNSITGNPTTRLNKIRGVVENKENTYQNFLTKGEGKNVFLSKEKLIGELESLKNHYKTSDLYDFTSATREIDKAVGRLKLYKGDNIPASNVNGLKRSVYDSAFNDSNKIISPIKHDIGGLLKQNLEEATDGLKIVTPTNPQGLSMADFNREYGVALTSKTLLNAAVGRAELGLVGKITSKVVGGALGSPFGAGGSVAGLILGDQIAKILIGTNTRSHLSSLLSKIAGAGDDSSPSSQATSATASKISSSKDIKPNPTTPPVASQGGNPAVLTDLATTPKATFLNHYKNEVATQLGGKAINPNYPTRPFAELGLKVAKIDTSNISTVAQLKQAIIKAVGKNYKNEVAEIIDNHLVSAAQAEPFIGTAPPSFAKAGTALVPKSSVIDSLVKESRKYNNAETFLEDMRVGFERYALGKTKTMKLPSGFELGKENIKIVDNYLSKFGSTPDEAVTSFWKMVATTPQTKAQLLEAYRNLPRDYSPGKETLTALQSGLEETRKNVTVVYENLLKENLGKRSDLFIKGDILTPKAFRDLVFDASAKIGDVYPRRGWAQAFQKSVAQYAGKWNIDQIILAARRFVQERL